MSYPERPPSYDDFEIAILCAKPEEAAPVFAMFDKHWEEDGAIYDKAEGDENEYRLGRIGRHDVVLAFASGQGKSNAASVAGCLRMTFKKIVLLLVVGVCGGVPGVEHSDSTRRIFLGDVVISTQVVQYDFVTQYVDEFRLIDTFRGATGEVLSFLAPLQMRTGGQNEGELESGLSRNLDTLFEHQRFQDSLYPGGEQDKLFNPSYQHKHYGSTCQTCANETNAICEDARNSLCPGLCYPKEWDPQTHIEDTRNGSNFVFRETEQYGRPRVHFGWIASADKVMKSSTHRQDVIKKIASKYEQDEEKIIAFEMEAAGVWRQQYNIVVVKGVCDYADGHKDDRWQKYAAATAAACTKAMLKRWRKRRRDWSDQQDTPPMHSRNEQPSNNVPRLALPAPTANTGFIEDLGLSQGRETSAVPSAATGTQSPMYHPMYDAQRESSEAN